MMDNDFPTDPRQVVFCACVEGSSEHGVGDIVRRISAWFS